MKGPRPRCPALSGRARAARAAVAVAILAAFSISARAADAAPPALATCVACHGTHGEGATTGIPRLAGQNVDYLSKALSAFKVGARASDVMQPIARTLADADIRALAAYFAGQEAPPVDAPAASSARRLFAGRRLAERGLGSVPACFSCHGAGGKGDGARFPSIAGQPAAFVVARLAEFQARAQVKAPEPGTMTAVAALLDRRQIEDAAAYLSKIDR
jgi:cytochrome c553